MGIIVVFVLPSTVWGVCAVCAFWAYLLSPLRRGDEPRYAPAALALLSVVASFGAAIDCACAHKKFESGYSGVGEDTGEDDAIPTATRYVAPRPATSPEIPCDAGEVAPAAGENSASTGSAAGVIAGAPPSQTLVRSLLLRTSRLVPVVIFTLFSLGLAVFFASGLGICGHATCGADIAWSLISFGLFLLWTAALGISIAIQVRRNRATLSRDSGAPTTGGDEELVVFGGSDGAAGDTDAAAAERGGE